MGLCPTTSPSFRAIPRSKFLIVMLRFPKVSLALPFVRTRSWRTVFVLFRVVTLQDDHRRHVLLCQSVRRRYSVTRRKWLWSSVP